MKNVAIGILILLAGKAWAQTVTLQGTVRNEQQQAVPFANVLLYHSKDSTFAKGAVSDTEGAYVIAGITPGNYYEVVSALSYKKFMSQNLVVDTKTKVLVRDFVLQEEATGLDEVVIEAQRPLIKQEAGTLTVSVENSALNSGQMVAETLRRVPGVTVDKDGKVTLKGKDGVMVMIDDKPLYMDAAQVGALLKSIPSDQVKEIEVLTSPSARYDAAGNAGIINIRLKRGAHEGLNGSVTSSGGHGVYPKSNAGAHVSYKKDRLSLTGGYQYNYDKELNRSFINRRYHTEAGDSSYYTKSDFAEPERAHSVLFSGSYETGKNGVLSWDGNVLLETSKWQGASDSYLYTSEGSLSSYFRTTDDSRGKFQNVNIGVGYKHTFDTTGTMLSTLAEFKTTSRDGNQNFVTEYFDGHGAPTGSPFYYRSSMPVSVGQGSVKIDFEKMLPGALKLEAGLKHNTIETSSDVNNTLTGENYFDYTENIEAAYAMLQKSVGKWKFNGGLRLEHTSNKGFQRSIDSTFTRSYTNLFPSATISFEPSGKTSYSLLYSRRIERPDYADLNPFSYYSDPYSIYSGNPYLLPQFTHHTEFTVSKWEGAFLATVNYSYTQQPQFGVFLLDKENLTTTYTNANLSSSVNYGLSLSLNLPVNSWWTMSHYFYIYNNLLKGDVGHGQVNLDRVSYLINSTQTFSLPRGISAEVSLMYEAPHYWGTVLYQEVWELSAGVQKKFFNEKLGVKISATDLFWKHVYVGHGVFGSTTTHDSFKWDNRVVMMSLSYRFGHRVSLDKGQESNFPDGGMKRR